MARKISFMIAEAKTKLTKFGMCLFYFYLLLSLLGCIGIIFGITQIIFKFIPNSHGVATSWWQLLALVLVSGFAIKLFLREAACLLESDTAPENNQSAKSNVIPFAKRNR